MGKLFCLNISERGFLSRARKNSGGKVVSSRDSAFAGDFNQTNGFRLAWLEADRSARRNVQTFAVGLGAIELERGIRFDEMIMAADLDGPVTEICYGKFYVCSTCAQFDLAFLHLVSSGLNVI